MSAGKNENDDEKRSSTGNAYPDQGGADSHDNTKRNTNEDDEAVLGKVNGLADKRKNRK